MTFFEISSLYWIYADNPIFEVDILGDTDTIHFQIYRERKMIFDCSVKDYQNSLFMSH